MCFVLHFDTLCSYQFLKSSNKQKTSNSSTSCSVYLNKTDMFEIYVFQTISFEEQSKLNDQSLTHIDKSMTYYFIFYKMIYCKK